MSATSQSDSLSCTTIDLLRHGVCEGGDILRGSTDVALLPEGMAQMDDAIRHQPDWNRVISSPLKRCREFAERIAEQRGLAVHVDKKWREIDFGEWDGLKIESIQANFPKESQLYYSQPTEFTPPGAESMLDFQERVIIAFNALVEQYRGERLLVIQHGGTIRVILAHILDIPLSHSNRVVIPYACLTRIRVYHSADGNYPVLIAHIPGPPANDEI